MFRQFLENEILMCAKLNFRDANPEPETSLTPDLGELDFKASFPGLRVLPLEDNLELVLEKESKIRLDKNENESTQLVDGSELLALRENHFASERMDFLPKNKRSLSQTHSYNSNLQSPTSNCTYNRQAQLVSQTSSFSSVSTALKGPCDQETEHFLPSKRAKRKGIICCCVG